MKKRISVLITLLIAFCLSFALFSYVKKIVSKQQISGNINQVIEGKFTDIQITDGESAIKAVKEFGPSISLTTAIDELAVQNITTTNERTYYRLQQNYKGIPVYGCAGVVVADGGGEAQGFTTNMREITADIDLEPSISRETVVSKVDSYVKEKLSLDADSEVTLSTTDQNNLTIFHPEDAKSPVLCYDTTVDVNNEPFKIIIDADSGDVLEFYTLKYRDSYSFETEGDIEKKLENRSKGINIYSANGNTLIRNWYLLDEKLNKYTSDGGRWVDSMGNSPNDTDILQVKVVLNTRKSSDSLENNSDKNKVEVLNDYSTKVYEFYEEILGRTSFNGKGGSVGIVYNDYMDGKNDNAYSETLGYLTILSFGINESISPDLVAHEYTHSVESSESHMKYDGQSGAIMEGYSDIFGEIFEDWDKDGILNSDCDWILGNRTIYDPSKNGYPEKVTDKENGKIKGEDGKVHSEDYVHGHSTVVSHAAYLMTKGVNNKYECIDMETLTHLWYNTLLTLPSDCTFSVLRDHMEMMASIMNLSEEQMDGISAAFEKVGIESQNTYSNNFSIVTYNTKGNPCPDYKILISNDDYHNEISINNTSPYHVELNRGTYNITVSNGTSQQTRQIKVRKNGENKELRFVLESSGDADSDDVLSSYASEYTYQYGKSFDGYVKRKVDENSIFDDFEYDYSMVPQGELAYHIADFDGDGAQELLILSFSEEYSLVLKMYEQDVNGVVLRDKIDLKEVNIFMTHTAAVDDYDIKPALFDVFTYGKNKTSIGIETYEHEAFLGDGKNLHFISVSYNGDTLNIDVNAGAAGSSGQMDMATYYIPELEKMDITPSWYKIFGRERQVYHYLENYHDIMRIETSYLCDGNEATNWMESDSDSIKCFMVHFYDQKELEKSTKQVRKEQSEFAKTKWKDEYIHYIEQAYAKDTDESYTYQLVYIDKNKIPELLVDYASYAGGMDVCTYGDKNKLEVIHVDYGFTYQQRENLFMISNGRFDDFYNVVYKIKNGSFVEVLSGRYGILDYSNLKRDANGNPIYQYSIDERVVNEDEYKRLLNKTFPEATAKTPEYVNSYEIMRIIDSF